MKYIETNSRVLICFLFIICMGCSCGTKGPNNGDDIEALTVFWEYPYENTGAPRQPPIVFKDTMISLTGNRHLSALSVETGELIWETDDFGDRPLDGRRLLQVQGLLFSSHFNDIRAWDANTGERKWLLETMPPLSLYSGGFPVALSDGFAVVGESNQMFKVNRSGELVFNKYLEYPILNLGYNKGVIYVGQRKTIHGALTLGRITALEAENGDSLWAFSTENGGFSWAAPIVEGGVVYAGTSGNSEKNVYLALDAETGAIIWEYITYDPGKWTRNFTIGPKHLFFAGDARLFALHKSTGELAWEYSWEGSAFVQQVYLEGYVYHSDHGSIFVLDAETGELVHGQPGPEGGGYIWHLAVSEDKLFVQSSYKLVAYQPWHLREE